MKKVLSGILALVIAGSFSVSAFAAAGDITAEEVTVTVGDETKTPTDELKDSASEEEEMLRISENTLLKIKLKLEGDDASGKDMSFITNKVLGDGETIDGEKIQFIDEKTIGEDGTVTIQFRPRLNSDVGIYNMRANAEGAKKFSKFYKTVQDQKQPAITKPSGTQSGDNIVVTIADYTEAWKNANKLFVIVNDEPKEITTYTIKDEDGTGTLTIPATGDLATPKEYTLKFIPTTDGSAYNPITFQATVTEKVYSVTFDIDGVSVDTFKASDLEKEAITLPTKVTKTGYTFEGWYKDAETKVETITSTNLASLYGTGKTLSLAAKFTPITYNITYNLDNGENADGNPEKYTIEDEDIKLQDPTRTGYTFAGWYSDEEKTKPVEKITKGSTGDVTLYAKWEAKMLDVTKSVVSTKGNNVVGETANVISGVDSTVQEGAEVTFTVTPPAGYTVESVKCNDVACETTEGGYKLTASGAAVGITVTLEPIEYTIEFNLNGGSANGEFEAVKGTIETPPTLPTEKPTKAGHHFGGWFIGSENGDEITQELINNRFADIIPSFDATHKITAVASYTENSKYTVIYEATGATDTPSTEANIDWEQNKVITISATEPVKEGYTFAGWKVKLGDSTDFASEKIYKKDGDNKTYTVGAGVTKVTFVAQWTANTYTITYVLDDGTNDASNPDEYTTETETITLADPTKYNYTFEGWYTEAAFTNKTTSITKGSTGDMTLYAKWTAVTYTITLSNDGETGEINGTVEDLPALTTPKKDGYVFKGWYTAAEGGEKIAAITADNIAALGDTTLYARWDEIETDAYQIVSFNAENSTVKVIKRTEASAFLIVATYTEDQRLVKATIKDITSEKTNALGKDIEIPNAFVGEYTNVRVFMWDTLDSMLPRCTAYPAANN